MDIYIKVIMNIADIVIAALILYQLMKFIVKSEKVIFVINAIVLIILLYALSIILHLSIVEWLLTNVFSWGIVLIFILFQNEIRNSLESLGNNTHHNIGKLDEKDFVENFVNTLEKLSKDKIGALITFEMDMNLLEYTSKAIELNATYSNHLIFSIFNKESPLHDGAIIIKDTVITHASTYFPIGLDLNVDKKYGTRHRSALTISELTDSITVIVSEETGGISIAYKGNLYADLEKDFIVEYLNNKLEK